MDGRSGAAEADIREAIARNAWRSDHDDRINSKSQGRKPVLVQPKPASETASREAGGAAIMDDRTKPASSAVTMRAERP
jgi:hypothetical protein